MKKRKRHKIYVAMLLNMMALANSEGYESSNLTFCCLLWDFSWNYDVKDFKELQKRKPAKKDRNGAYWFTLDKDGYNKRVAILIKAILKTT